MMPLLAFDTAGPHCAACLLVGGKSHTRVDDMAKGQAEHLMPMLSELLADHGLDWRDLAALGVGTGPGNFTGIRISVAAARGLALGRGIPAVGVTHLEAQVFGLPRPATAQIAAPRRRIYVQTFTDTASTVDLVDADDPRALAAAPLLPPARVIANIAIIAASRAALNPPRPAPFYARPADAAPPRDPAPVILP